jgi:hypothetical protein
MDGIEVNLLHGPYNGKDAKITEQENRRGIAYFNDGDQTITYARNAFGVWCWADKDAIPDTPATAGRIVWYMPTEEDAKSMPGIDFDQEYRSVYLPAIVVSSFKNGTVNLKVFGHGGIDAGNSCAFF